MVVQRLSEAEVVVLLEMINDKLFDKEVNEPHASKENNKKKKKITKKN